MQHRVEEFRGGRLAFIRVVGPYWETVGPAFDRFCAVAGPKGWFAIPGSLLLATYHDSPREVPLDKMRADVGMLVNDSVMPEGDIQVREMPAGKYAVFTHVGPYSGLRHAWEEAHAMFQQNGLHFRNDGECFEVYVDDPTQVPESQVRTDIYLAVK
jgi:AraC family transcriptional regulator